MRGYKKTRRLLGNINAIGADDKLIPEAVETRHTKILKMASRNAMKYSSRLHGSRVLVFGATSGIGFAVAEASVEHGAHVIVSGSNQGRIDKTIKALQESYPDYADHVLGAVVDLADRANVEHNLKTMFETVTKGGTQKLNHIAFTAGDSVSFLKIADVNVNSMFDVATVRFGGPMLVGKFAPMYIETKEAGGSSITFTSGTNSYKPAPGWSTIAPWGMALDGLARGLAVEFAPGIRVNVVSPGAIDTPLLRRGGRGEEGIQKMREGNLLKKIGRPEDMAEAYTYLMRDGFVTGQVLQSEGGRSLT